MGLHLLYEKDFEPIVRPDENVKLLLPQGHIYGRVVFVEPLQPIVVDVGPLKAAGPSSWPAVGTSKELDELELGSNEFGQWRMLVLDDFLVEFRLPAAMGRFVTKNGATYVSKLSTLLAKNSGITEFYTYSDQVPQVVTYNPNFYDLLTARMVFAGFRYVFEPLREEPKEYTVIPTAGMPPRGK